MQSSLFSDTSKQTRPLADRLRPSDLSEVKGQEHLLGKDGVLTKMLEASFLPSLILWGPPGCGKTTIALMLAQAIGHQFALLSAVSSGVADLKKLFEQAAKDKEMGRSTLLMVDEIHRFNRAQQDVLLPYVEEGVVTLVGATTENPSFELNAALLSRCRVLVLKALQEDDLMQLLSRAEEVEGKPLPIDDEGRLLLCRMADGDGRYLFNLCEALFAAGERLLTSEQLLEFVQKRMPLYDKQQDSHYNLISALHKSLRGSDVNAALYWFGRMLHGGEDPLYIARRLVRFAVEDIGLADPQSLVQANAAKEAYQFLGSPEGELALTQAVIYLATASKSNASYTAYKQIRRAASEHASLMPPKHILNAPTQLMKDEGYGKDYQYDHDAEDGFSGQNYFPDGMSRAAYYQPKDLGFEKEIGKRLNYWQKLREKKCST